jgi:hypothetical protein
MRIRQHHAASALFAFSAFAYLGIWYTLLFVAVPERQTPAQHAASLLFHVFFESGLTWYFVYLALMPLVLASLAVVALRLSAQSWRFPSRAAIAAFASTALVLFMSWEIALIAGSASYFAVFDRDG